MSGEAHFEICRRSDGDFGWRFKGANGEISAISGEGFTRREDANRAIHDFLAAVWESADPHPPIVDIDG